MIRQQAYEPVYDFMTLEQKPGGDVIEFGNDAIPVKPVFGKGIPGRIHTLGYPVDAQGNRIARPDVSATATATTPVAVVQTAPPSSNPILTYGLIALAA